jgi:NAD(P)H-flavin reductase
MGVPSHIGEAKKVICVGGGLGVAPIYPQARGFKEAGAYVIGVVGFRSRDLIFWEDKFREVCDELIICTDDGSAGVKGLVTLGIEQAVAKHPDIDEVIAIGPPIMMRACAETTRPHGIKTSVSLNPRRHRHVWRLPGKGGRAHKVRLRRWPGLRRTYS